MRLISIMMLVYNADQFVARAIKSVCEQTYPNWELIVVNGGSSDRTAEIVNEFTNPRIQVIHQENGGESVARNTALDHMSGDFVTFLDGDDMYRPHHLERLVDLLESAARLDGVYTDGEYCDTNDVPGDSLSSHRRGPFEGDVFPELVRASDVFGPPICVMLRRQPIVARGLRFDPEIVIGPDWDFMTRFAEHARFGYVDGRSCLYRVHQTNITLRTDQKQRALYLTRCREKAIQLERFPACPLDVRIAVFYDLLVNLLHDEPERQAEIIVWPEFTALPDRERARLLRLMDSKSILATSAEQPVRQWLALAHTLNPYDRKATWLSRLYDASPSLCRSILSARLWFNSQHKSVSSPFGEMA